MLKRNNWLKSEANRCSRNSRGTGKTKPSQLVTAIRPILETLETRQLLSLAAGALDPTLGSAGTPIENNQGIFFGSIQAAVDGSPAGDIITVAAGTYTENVTINENITIDGAGNSPTTGTVVQSASASSPVFDITGNGTNATLNGFYITGGTIGKTSGIQVDVGASASVSDITIHDPLIGADVSGTATFDGDVFEDNSIGMQIENGGVAFVVDGSSITDNTTDGINVLAGGTATIDASSVSDNATGIVSLGTLSVQHAATILNNSVDGIDITGGTLIAIGGASIGNNGGNGVDVSAGSANLTGTTISGSPIGVLVQSTGDAIIGDDTTVGDGNNIYGNATGIEFTAGSTGSVAGNAFFDENNPLSHNAVDAQIDANAGAGITLGDGNAYDGDTDYIVSNELGHNWGMSHDANVTFDGFNAATSTVNATTLSTFYAIEDKIIDGIDQSGLGVVYIHDTSVFVTPNSFIAPAIDNTDAIQRAVDAASPGDTVYVEAGDYLGGFSITEALTLDGAGAGVNASGRSGAESIIDGGGGSVVGAAATIDGFTIENVTSSDGMYLAPSSGGSQVLNNIFQGNVFGLYLNNNGSAQTLVSQNLFLNNDAPGSSSGNSIYSDQDAENVLIDSNTFDGSGDFAVTLRATSSTINNNLTISNNLIENEDIFLLDSSNVTVLTNVITGAIGGVVIAGGNSNILVKESSITGSSFPAVELDSLYGFGPNSDVVIAQNYLDGNDTGVLVNAGSLTGSMMVNINHITGNTVGLENDSTTTIDATQNWWGTSDGPNTTLNTFKHPTTGDSVVGSDVLISPWLDDGIDANSATNPPNISGFQHAPTSATTPAAPSAPDLEAAEDSGASNTDNITNVQTPHFDGTSTAAEAGDTVTLYDTDGTTILGTSTVLSDGSWIVQTSTLANGAHTITAVITDGFGNQSAPSDSLIVDIDHLAPAPTITEAAESDQEGALVSLTAAVNDPNPTFGSPSFDWHVVASNGQTIADGTSQNFSFTPNDNGTYTVTYAVTDAAGNVGSTQDIIQITNVAPTASLSTNIAPGTEGAAIDLTASATDPSTADTAAGFIYNWTITKQRGAGPATTYLTGSFGPAATADINFTPDDDSTYVVTVTATDKDGGISTITAASTKTFVVTNVAPTATITGAPTTSPAGVAINLGSTVTDPSSADTTAGFHFLWSVTLNGNPYTTDLGATNGPTFTFTPVVFGSFVISFTATDKDGGFDTVTAPINVTEVTPAITLSGSKTDPANPTPNDAEGSTFTLTLGALQDTDLIAGGDTVNQYSILWGDSGNATTITGAQLADLVANGGTVTHVYQDGTAAESSAINTNIQVFVTVTDGFGVQHSFDPATGGTLGINVYNVAPTGELTGATTVTEGTSGFVQFINQSDPSPTDTAAGFTYEYDFNNSGNFTAPTTSSSATVPASFLSTSGTVTVAARIIDKDGGFTTDTINVNVTNIAPSVNTIANITNQLQNSDFHTTGTFTDPGNDSPWVVFVNYDSTHVAGIGSQIQSGSSQSFSLSNIYTTPGIYTVLVTVQDLGGPANNALSLSGSTTFTVTVTATTFQVTQFTPTVSGFDVTFNRAVNISLLHLYGSSRVGGFGTTSDLTITGQNTGPVTGSLVWDPTINTAHFIKTGGPLAADTYSIVLLSGSNGWLDTSADQLDGQSNGSNSNYTNSFTVTTPSTEPVAGIPDFARGPGQAVNVPANGAGLNVQLSNVMNILSVDFDLVYNPSLLTITGATKAPGLPADWGITTNNVSAGQINFSISGITQISGSLLNILTLTANIPVSAPYASAADLQLTNLVVSQLTVGTIPSLADSTMEKVAYLGDTDGDGQLTGNDAGLISRVVVHLDSGFDAYQLTDPTLIGDVSGDGVFTGFDASEDLSASVGLSEPTIPIIPSIGTLTGGGVDPNVSIPTDVVSSGSMALVPVNIDDLTGVNGSTFTVGFDPTGLQLPSSTNVTISSQLSADWVAIYNPSTSKIGFFDTNPQDATYTGPATLFNMSFNVPANSNPGVEPITITGPVTVGNGTTALQYTYTNGSVVIPPTFTGNNQFTVALDGSGNVDVWQDVPETSAATYVFSQSLLSLPAFSVFSFTTTQAGGSLTIDSTHGDPLSSGGVIYNATGTGNTLAIDADNNGDNFTVGSSGATWTGNPLSLSNVHNFIFNGGTGNDTLTQTSQPAGTVTFNGGTGSDILNVNGGSYSISNGGENPSESLTVNVNNAGSSITFNGDTTLAALNVGDGASATIPTSTSTPSVLITSALSILGTGKLNVTNNELIFHSTAANRANDLAALTALLSSGASFNNFANYWAGPGIDSSSATGTGFTTGVGILLNYTGSSSSPDTYTTGFGGQSVSDTDILVRYTFYGDADLNGTVNATDYTLVDNGFDFGLTGWVNGDFNYDGKINGDDYSMMDNAFNEQGGQTQVLAVNASQIAVVAPPASTTSVASSPVVAAASNAAAAVSSSTADDTTDLKKKRRSVYSQIEDT
jgi:Bacterial Ig-like domain/Right handed beta helix region